jgi:hypothetical protein
VVKTRILVLIVHSKKKVNYSQMSWTQLLGQTQIPFVCGAAPSAALVQLGQKTASSDLVSL